MVWLQTAIVPKLRSSLAQKKTAERKIVKKIAFFKDLTALDWYESKNGKLWSHI